MAGENDEPQDGDAVSDTEKLKWFNAIEVAPRKGLGIIGDNPPTTLPRPTAPITPPADYSNSEPGPRKRRRFRR